jgi:hypothetical protein
MTREHSEWLWEQSSQSYPGCAPGSHDLPFAPEAWTNPQIVKFTNNLKIGLSIGRELT